MWTMTPRGFYSVVAHRGKPDTLLLRARVKADLLALDDLIPAEPIADRIWEDRKADYQWRAEVTRAEWAYAVGQMAVEVNYGNFKDAVTARQGKRRHDVYLRVWSALLELAPVGQGRYAPSTPLGAITVSNSAGHEDCPTCAGTGYGEGDAFFEDCPACKGRGEVRIAVNHRGSVGS